MLNVTPLKSWLIVKVGNAGAAKQPGTTGATGVPPEDAPAPPELEPLED